MRLVSGEGWVVWFIIVGLDVVFEVKVRGLGMFYLGVVCRWVCWVLIVVY